MLQANISFGEGSQFSDLTARPIGISVLNPDKSIRDKELQEMLGLKNADHFRKAYLLSAIDSGFIEMPLPGKPKSRFQKYRITHKGRKWLAGQHKHNRE